MTCPTGPAVCRFRGDTFPQTFTLKNPDGTPFPLTTHSFKLSVDPNPDPDDETGQLFKIVPTILDGPNGVIQFALDATEADQLPDTYYYDLEMTDPASAIRTIAKAEFEFQQDITKT